MVSLLDAVNFRFRDVVPISTFNILNVICVSTHYATASAHDMLISSLVAGLPQDLGIHGDIACFDKT